jgi:flagella basal body P-ring formation protein FlgA
MSSFAKAWLAVLVGCVGTPALAEVPAVIAQPLLARVAEEWGIAPDRLCVEWGQLAVPGTAVGNATPRIVGRGADGWFTAVAEAPGADPVALRFRCGILDTVWVAARALPRGARLCDGDLRADVCAQWGPPARDARNAPELGWETRRPLAAGEVVVWPAVVPPTVIAARDAIRVEWSRAGVRVELEGVALGSAPLGGLVRVRVKGRERPIEATVVGPGRAVLEVERES